MSKDTQKRIADALNAIRTDGGITTSDATKSTQKRIRDAVESIRDLGLDNVPLVRADTVEAENVFNSDLGDDVDYIDPRSFAQSGATTVFWRPGVKSLSTASGTGGSLNNFADFRVTTGNTSGSSATAQVFAPASDSMGNNISWQRDITLSASAEIIGGDDGCEIYLGVISNANDFNTNPHIAFNVTSGELRGSVRNGSSQTETTLLNSPAAGKRGLRVDFTSGERAVFYVDGSKEGEITTDLPTSSNADPRRVISLTAKNSVASNRGIGLKDAVCVIMPE